MPHEISFKFFIWYVALFYLYRPDTPANADLITSSNAVATTYNAMHITNFTPVESFSLLATINVTTAAVPSSKPPMAPPIIPQYSIKYNT